jgi:hypothetical protein
MRRSRSNVSRGSFQNANVGYWVSGDRNGHGLARAVVANWSSAHPGDYRLEGDARRRIVTARSPQERLEQSVACATTLPGAGATTFSTSARTTPSDAADSGGRLD